MELPTGNVQIKILADADLILEFFANRSGYVEHVEALFETMQQSDELKVYITDYCLDKVRYYLSRQESSLGEEAVTMLKSLFDGRIIPIRQAYVDKARHSHLKDFESAIEVVCAIEQNLKVIVTHNPKNFSGADVSVWQAKQWEENFLKFLHASFSPVTETGLGLAIKSRLLEISKSWSSLTDQQVLAQVLIEAIAAEIPDLKDNPKTLASRIVAEVERAFPQNEQIRGSGQVPIWKTDLARQRLHHCLVYYRLGKEGGKAELQSILGTQPGITRQLHRPSDNYIAHARLLKSEITVPFANRIRSRG